MFFGRVDPSLAKIDTASIHVSQPSSDRVESTSSLPASPSWPCFRQYTSSSRPPLPTTSSQLRLSLESLATTRSIFTPNSTSSAIPTLRTRHDEVNNHPVGIRLPRRSTSADSYVRHQRTTYLCRNLSNPTQCSDRLCPAISASHQRTNIQVVLLSIRIPKHARHRRFNHLLHHLHKSNRPYPDSVMVQIILRRCQ